MRLRRRIHPSIIPTLGIGFTLAILLLLASGYVSLQILDRVETRAASLAEQQRLSTNLIDEIQGEEAGLSSLFYLVAASPSSFDRKPLLERLASIERDIGRTLAAGLQSSSGNTWKAVSAAVSDLLTELRRSLQQPGSNRPTEELYARHETLVKALATLVATNYETTVQAQRHENSRSRRDLQRGLALLVIALVLSIGCAIWTLYIAKQVFERVEWQARELSRLSAHVLETQETTIRNFSRELHDDLGQTLSAVEANLVAVQPASLSQQDRLQDCMLLIKDAISKVREMAQFLRPAMLDDFGLGPSLQSLAEGFEQRTGIKVQTRIEFDGRASPAVETHIFRIAQEALTNVGRHSGATSAELMLGRDGGNLRLTVSDNGRGLPDGRSRGFGLMGMRERMSTAGGRFNIESTNNGVTINAEAPIDERDSQPANSNIARG